MVDDQRGVDVDTERLTRRWGGASRPGRRPRRRAGATDLRQVRGVDTLIDQSPHGRRGGLGPEHVLAVPAELPDSVDAVRPVGHRRGQIREHRPRSVRPRPLVGIGQNLGDLRRQPGQIGQLTQQPHPGMRHHPAAIRRNFHPPDRRDSIHLRSAFPLDD